MTDIERKHIADLLGEVIVMVRTAELTPAQVDERLTYLQFLLDHPGYYAPEANLMEAADG